ncbi:unnamed protein product [Diplocarpon coronariae]
MHVSNPLRHEKGGSPVSPAMTVTTPATAHDSSGHQNNHVLPSNSVHTAKDTGDSAGPSRSASMHPLVITGRLCRVGYRLFTFQRAADLRIFYQYTR